MFFCGNTALRLVHSNHIGDLLLRIKEAADLHANLDVLENIRAYAAVLHGLLTSKVVVVAFLPTEVLQHEHIAVVLHPSLVILELSKIVPYK